MVVGSICYNHFVMPAKLPFTADQLYSFIDKAGSSTYAAVKVDSVTVNETGFKELNFVEGDFSYKDTYTGYYRSRGMELVRFKGAPVWSQLYGGGMTKGKESLTNSAFVFLKKALSTGDPAFQSFRGPGNLKDSDWEYKYKQEGDVFEFHGHEEIFYKGEPVFFHRTIGGLIVPRE